jgi:Flp pilus assembly protein TadG
MFRRISLRAIAGRLPGLRRFARDRRGSVAIEFAFVGLPFFLLLFAIIEVSMVFLAGQLLEKGTQDASRKILTGQAQTANFTQAQFKQEVCNQVTLLLSCTNVFLDVESFPTIGRVDIRNPIDTNGNFVNNFAYRPGGPNDLVVVRVMYQWPLFVPGLSYWLADIAGTKKLLMATATFRNEPYL